MTFDSLNATNLGDVLSYSNTVTGGWFWTGLLYVVFLLSFFVLSNRSGFKRALAASSFFTTLLGLVMNLTTGVFASGALVTTETVLIFLVISIGSVILLFLE